MRRGNARRQYSTFTLTRVLVFEPPLPSMRIGGLDSQAVTTIAPAATAARRVNIFRRDIGRFSIPEIYSRVGKTPDTIAGTARNRTTDGLELAVFRVFHRRRGAADLRHARPRGGRHARVFVDRAGYFPGPGRAAAGQRPEPLTARVSKHSFSEQKYRNINYCGNS